MEKKIAQKGPYVLDVKAGKYAWCSCGHSTNQPYCDGSHKGSGMVPTMVEIDVDKKIAFCGCKNSSNGAFCDGAHAAL